MDCAMPAGRNGGEGRGRDFNEVPAEIDAILDIAGEDDADEP